MKRHSKAIGAVVGGGIGYSLAVVLSWIMGLFGVEIPDDVKMELGVLITAIVTVITVWLAPANDKPKANGRTSYIKIILVPLLALSSLAVADQAMAQGPLLRLLNRLRPATIVSNIRQRQAQRLGWQVQSTSWTWSVKTSPRVACPNWLGVPTLAEPKTVLEQPCPGGVCPVPQDNSPTIWSAPACPGGVCPVPTVSAFQRMPGPSWVIRDGRNVWDHLEAVHGFQADGLTRQQAKAVHDNIHNGWL